MIHLQVLAVEAPRGFPGPAVSSPPCTLQHWTAPRAPTPGGDGGEQLLSPLVVALVVAQLSFNHLGNTYTLLL